MPDGSVVVVEILGERVIRVCPDGSIDVVAEVPGVPMVWPSAQRCPVRVQQRWLVHPTRA